MTDFKAEVHGTFQDGTTWSFGTRITSSQPLSTIKDTWANAWTAAWTDGTHGLGVIYPTTTTVTGFTVARLNGTMKEVEKIEVPAALAGGSSDNSLPYMISYLVSLRSNLIQKTDRGRINLPAPVEGIVVNDLYTLASATRVRDAVAAVFGAIRADGSTIFVTNLKKLDDDTPAYQHNVITYQLVSRKPARQSRRVKKIRSVYV